MYDVVAKTLWMVAQPSNFIALILLIGLLLLVFKRPGASGFLILGAFLLTVGGLLPTGNLLLAPLENRFPSLAKKLPGHVDGIIILGGGEQAHLSYARGQISLNNHSERLITGALLARHYPNARIIHSGGVGRRGEMTESDVAKAFFAGLGLKGDRFIYEDQSHNSFENATTTLKLAHPKPGETWLLVTSAFHMPRAVGAFRLVGWTIIPYPVDYITDGKRPDWRHPNVAQNLEELDLAVHEWIGQAAYQILGKSSELFPGT